MGIQAFVSHSLLGGLDPTEKGMLELVNMFNDVPDIKYIHFPGVDRNSRHTHGVWLDELPIDVTYEVLSIMTPYPHSADGVWEGFGLAGNDQVFEMGSCLNLHATRQKLDLL